MIMQDGITAAERVKNLGCNNELKLSFYLEKSKRLAIRRVLSKYRKKVVNHG